jgi:hypothetical protein
MMADYGWLDLKGEPVRQYRSRLIAAAALLTSVLAVTAFMTVTAHHQASPPAHSKGSLAASLRSSAALHVVKSASTKSPDPKKPTAHAHGASTKPGAATGGASGGSPSGSGSIDWGNPIFTDYFNTPLNPNYWAVYNEPNGAPNSGTPYTKQSVSVADGDLDITGHEQAPYGFVAGGLESLINQTYGRWVIRFRAQNGAGYEPAVLLWPEGTHADGEIDMAEVYPGTAQPASTNRLGAGQFLHIGAANRVIGHKLANSVNFNDWQTIAVDWLPSGIQMYLNGTLTWSVSTNFDGTDYIPDTPFHLAMQLDEGCTRSRCRPNSATPSNVVMQVDWVRIYAAPKG